MESEKLLSRTEGIYRQSANKQRIVILGNTAATIAAMARHVLNAYHRKFDLVSSLNGTTPELSPEAPVVIITENTTPYTTARAYHHHIGVIGEVDQSPAALEGLTHFSDATPKAGILIYPDADLLADIGKKPRPDVTAISYGPHPHQIDMDKVMLIVSSSERFPTLVSGDSDLRSLSAARELLAKIGITPSQFYAAIASFAG